MANGYRSVLAEGGGSSQFLVIGNEPTKTSYFQTEPLDLTGFRVLLVNSSGSTDITSSCTVSPSTATTVGTTTCTVTYSGLTATFDVTVASIPASLEDASWSLINTLAKAGIFGNYYSVGDTKSVVINNTTLHMQVAGINDGTGTAGTYYPDKTVDFVSVEIFTTSAMCSSAVNSDGWHVCNVRSYLNDTLYLNFPNILKNIIVDKTHYRDGYTDTDKLWLPTEIEATGSVVRSADSSTYSKHYSAFSTASARQKSSNWWLSSRWVGDNKSYCQIDTSGNINGWYANVGHGVVIGFRIGEAPAS